MKKHLPITRMLPLLLTLATLPVFAGEKEDAQAFIEQEMRLMVETINSDTLSPNAKRAITERQIRKHLALGHMTARSLGSLAAKFTLQEFADFSQEFQDHLLYFYLERAATFVGDSVEITNATLVPETSEVLIETLGGERGRLFRSKGISSMHKSKVDYHLLKTANRWQISKIVIEGVDVDANFRAQFQSVLKRKSPKAIIQQLRDSNAKKDKINPFD